MTDRQTASDSSPNGPSRRPLIAGNWKMHKLPSEAQSWTREFLAALETLSGAGGDSGDNRDSGNRGLACDVALAVPFTHLLGMARLTFGSALALGSQDVSAHEQGAYTGEVAAAMVKDCGATYAVVGHSERRAYHAEDDALINQKLVRSFEAGLVPILCVGETREQRDAGDAEEVVIGQLHEALAGVSSQAAADLVVAYEPVWAIGTGLTATAADAQDMCAAVRRQLASQLPEHADAIRIVYGGSMKPSNAVELLAQPDIDGGLIGGASLARDDLLEIVRAATR